MLLPRIIPCLLVKNKGLVKTVRFKSPIYVGDPINAVKIFNEKEVDELIVLDIDATTNNREPDYKMIENLAAECRMPLCYGGGVTTVEQIRRIIISGVEKVSISSAAISNPMLVKEAAEVFGSQSIVVVIDVKKNGKKYEVFSHNGKFNTHLDPVSFALEMARLGAGEIVINSIDNDGMMKGYDLDITEKILSVIHIPVTILGGAGSLRDIRQVLEKFGQLGIAAGSLFVFKGPYKAVLINYPVRSEKQQLMSQNFMKSLI